MATLRQPYGNPKATPSQVQCGGEEKKGTTGIQNEAINVKIVRSKNGFDLKRTLRFVPDVLE